MAKAKSRQGGLTLVSDLSKESFVQFLQTLAKKPRSVDGIGDLTRQQLANVYVALEREVRSAIAAAGGLEVDPTPDVRQSDNEPEAIILTLHGAAVLALELLTKGQQSPPAELLSVATMLHDEVIMSAVDVELQDAAMRLCCAWWERGLPGKETLVPRLIPYVLVRAVQDLDRGRTCLVHLCYSIREALELLDYEDGTIQDTKRLLLLTAMHPAFLRDPKGRRFVAGLFRLEPQMTRELAAIVRNQIPSGQRVVLEAYGEILFRAWRDTVGSCAAEVEAELQTLMQAAIAASTPQLAAALRTVLNGLHSHKSLEKRLNPALVRLYDPVLPRAFTSANSEIRRNAVTLLVAAFPIMDPEAPVSENHRRLTQQLGFLTGGLSDPCPGVREAAVAGCCHCLKFFWEIVPAATSAKIIADITGKLAYDKHSPTVCIAALSGLTSLVESQHALPVLKKALPAVAPLLHHKRPAVREALADLLVAVSGCRGGLQFWDVVPLDCLLHCLAADKAPGVTRKVARILLPSYCPNAQEGAARLGALLRAKPTAGVAFCRNMVARFFPASQAPHGTTGPAAASSRFTASVPVEHVLQLAGDLAVHLLASAPGVVAAEERGFRSPPGKKPRAARGSGNVSGKKRAKKREAQAVSEGDEVGADDVGASHGASDAPAQDTDLPPDQEEEEEEDVVLQAAGSETLEGWLSVFRGLVTLAEGLGAAVEGGGEVGPADIEAALPAGALLGLLRAAEEQVRSPAAILLALKMAAALHWTPGAQPVRDVLFQRLAEGALPGLQGDGANEAAAEMDGPRCPREEDVHVLAEVLVTLAASDNDKKLVAVLSAALGVRQPQPIRKPVAKKANKSGKAVSKRGRDHHPDEDAEGLDALDTASLGLQALDLSGHGGDHEGADKDEIICHGCRCAQPADTMLLCDGCDAACHIHCLRPPLSSVPETDWFCCRCEAQLQAVRLSAPAASRCLALMLKLDSCRELLCDHHDFSAMTQALHGLAMAEADQIVRLAQEGATAAGEEEEAAGDSAAAHNEPTASAALSTTAVPLLHEPWGALSRYCCAALHRALRAARPSPGGPEDAEERKEGAGSGVARRPAKSASSTLTVRTPHRPPAASAASGGGRQEASAREQEEAEEKADGDAALTGLYEVVPVVDCAVQTCTHLAELVLAEPCLAGHLAALQYSQGALRALWATHHVNLLHPTAQYGAAMSYLCTIQATLAQRAAATLAAQQGGGGSPQLQHQRTVAGAIQAVLGLARQLVCAVHEGGQGNSGSDPAGKDDSADMPGEHADGQAASDQRQPGKREQQQEEEGAGQALSPEVSMERLAVALVTLLCDSAVGGLIKGAVRVGAADLLNELMISTMGQAEMDGWLGTLSRLTGEALLADPRTAADLEGILQGHTVHQEPAERSGPVAEGTEGTTAALPVRAAVGRNPRGRGAGGKRKAVVVGGDAASEALQATAAKLSQLLKNESPAVGAMATLLVRVCAARKAHGDTMTLLAHLAAGAASQSVGPAATQMAGLASPSQLAPQPVDTSDGEGGGGEGGAVALGASVLLTLVRVEAPASDAVPAAVVRGSEGPADTAPVAAEAAAEPQRAASVESGGVLQNRQHAQEGEEGAAAGQRARSLARSILQMLCNGGASVGC